MEQKHDVLTEMIHKAIECKERFPTCPPVAELIFTFIDLIKARGIKLTKADNERLNDGEWQSSEVRELVDSFADFIMRVYVKSYLELKGEDDVNRIARGFYNWFDEFA